MKQLSKLDTKERLPRVPTALWISDSHFSREAIQYQLNRCLFKGDNPSESFSWISYGLDYRNHVYPVAVTKVAKILVILGIHWQRVRHTIISKKPQLHKIKCRKSIWDFLLMCCITVGLLWGSMKLHRSWWKRILRDLIVCPLWKVWTLEAIGTEPHSHTVQL